MAANWPFIPKQTSPASCFISQALQNVFMFETQLPNQANDLLPCSVPIWHEGSTTPSACRYKNARNTSAQGSGLMDRHKQISPKSCFCILKFPSRWGNTPHSREARLATRLPHLSSPPSCCWCSPRVAICFSPSGTPLTSAPEGAAVLGRSGLAGALGVTVVEAGVDRLVVVVVEVEVGA